MTQLRLVLTSLIIGVIFVVSLTSCSPTQSRQPIPTISPVPSFTPTPEVKGPGTPGRACTMEARLCPDGSAVGRTGPNCEFALCPGEKAAPVATGKPMPQNK